MSRPRRKSVLKWLRRAVQSLPDRTYKAYHKFYEPRAELVDGKKVLRAGYLEDHPWNHYRRAKTVYDRHGMMGVELYFLQLGFKISNKKDTPD